MFFLVFLTLCSAKGEESMKQYEAGEDLDEIILVVELDAAQRHLSFDDIERKTAFLKNEPEEEEEETYVLTKGRKGRVVTPKNKTARSAKVTECQYLQKRRPGYDYKGNIHAYYIRTAEPNNKQKLVYRCRCNYCLGPRSNKWDPMRLQEI
eukprot:TRINITY_DN591_c0_g1_i1.p1 TRINITY_DN591_c0_g1~~TRINITY_DN591_c0_g1_i1.p1  ORF type:complete len:151 (+),score=38.74 TRINITY_DN591_c0_g1_i1:393-845(+)